MSLRARFMRWLRQWSTTPAGGIVAPEAAIIDDGVEYGLPPSVPYELALPGNEASLAEHVAKLAEVSTDFQMPFDTPYNRSNERLWTFPFVVPLREWDWTTRRHILERCHLAHERNPLAKRAVSVTTQYVVGTGLSITYRNEDVQDVLEAFRADPENAVEAYEKEFCSDLQVDGELFIRFFTGSDGTTVIVPLRPWEIAWIVTDPQFIKRVVSYHRQGYLSNGVPGNYEQVNDDILAGDMLHVPINKASYEQRGRPDLFVILPWLRAYKDWLEGRARANHWRGAVFLDLTLTGGTPGQVATKRAQYKQPPPPGSLYIHNDKESMEYKDSKVNAADVAEDGRQIKLMAAVGKGLPEYMLSDGQNSNLATASAQASPAVRTFTEFQDVMVERVWRPIYRRVVENAIAAGVLPEYVDETDEDGEPVLDPQAEPAGDELALTGQRPSAGTAGRNGYGPDGTQPLSKGNSPLESAAPATPKGKARQIKAVDAFDVAAPELESDDPYNLAQALQMNMANDLLSKETASAEAGYDYRVEKRKMQAEKAEAAVEQMDMRAQGLMPGPLPGQAIPPDPGAATDEPGLLPAAPAPNGRKNGYTNTAGTSEADVSVSQFRELIETIRAQAPVSAAGPTINNNLMLDPAPLAEAIRGTVPSVTVNVPEQAPPTVTVNVPETSAPQVVVNVPEQPAPVVNVSPVVTVNVPRAIGEKARVTRDADGKITGTDTSITYEDVT